MHPEHPAGWDRIWEATAGPRPAPQARLWSRARTSRRLPYTGISRFERKFSLSLGYDGVIQLIITIIGDTMTYCNPCSKRDLTDNICKSGKYRSCHEKR